MAKKATTKKKTKKVAKKPARARASASRSKKPATKKAAKKTAAKNTSAKKTATKKSAKKPTATKKVTKKKLTKASSKKAPAKRVAKKTTKKAPAKKTASKKPATKKTLAKKTSAKKPAASESTAKPESPKPAAPAKDDKSSNRKGITIKPGSKKTSSRSKSASKFVMPDRPQLLGPGSVFAKKPLIPSGPSAPKITSVLDEPKSKRKKSPLTKAKLEKYRQLLITKRAELLGDVTNMENEALRSGGSGGLSNTPQHAAEQGSENYDQTLSLNLAAQDRKLIKDIDDALARIEAGTYGLCELTAHPIPEARLNELPWARYTIEAARELERRGGSA